MDSWKLQLYRQFQKLVIKPLVLPVFFSHERRNPENFVIHSNSVGERPLWFHASSSGELESLWPVVLAWAKLKRSLIITIFSESAKGRLTQLLKEVQTAGGTISAHGYSPWDGEWRAALSHLKPRAFVTIKYEAWPELWCSLYNDGIPLFLLSARQGQSLKVAKKMSQALSGGIPKLFISLVSGDEAKELKSLFPESTLEIDGDPRWDRVALRSKVENPRVKKLLSLLQNTPKPWGVFGSVWPEDLEQIGSELKRLPGTLLMAPHKVDEKHLLELESKLKTFGFSSRRFSSDFQGDGPCLIVDEIGFLADLYSVADYAYVGGGFAQGLHNTIEPALFGIPIGCGPKNATKFPEVPELQKSGQLKILSTNDATKKWVDDLLATNAAIKNRNQWKSDAQSRLGATQRILEFIDRNA